MVSLSIHGSKNIQVRQRFFELGREAHRHLACVQLQAMHFHKKYANFGERTGTFFCHCTSVQRVMWLAKDCPHFSLPFTSHVGLHHSDGPKLHFVTETFGRFDLGRRINLKRPNGVEQQYRFYCRPGEDLP